MIFHIKRALLSEELSRLQSVVNKKNTIPILSQVRIQSEAHRIKLVATNLETTIYADTQTDLVETQGIMCAPAKQLFDISKQLPEGLVRIEKTENDWAHISCGRTKYKIPAADPASFPEVPNTADLSWLEIPAKTMRAMLGGVACAVAPDEDARYTLKGAKFEMDGIEVRMITTDGHRLCVASAPLETMLPDDLSAIIPAEGMADLNRMIADQDGSVGVASQDNKIFFRLGNRQLACSLLAGQYPDYNLILDTVKDHSQFATFKADELTRSVRRVNLTTDDSLALRMLFEDKQLFLRTNNVDTGECEEVLPSDFNGERLVIGCNSKYVIDFVSGLGSTAVRMDVQERLKPIHIETSKDGVKLRYVLMPMNIPE